MNEKIKRPLRNPFDREDDVVERTDIPKEKIKEEAWIDRNREKIIFVVGMTYGFTIAVLLLVFVV